MMHHKIEQNTDEWLTLRTGKVTGSSIPQVMANYGKPFGEPAKRYAKRIAVERITGRRVSSSGFSNSDMERGHQQEPVARMLYEQSMFCDVDDGGFFDLGKIGCSPDGLVGDDGVIEIKSQIANIHYDTVTSQSFGYKWQCISNLKFTGRDWLDFVSYCEEFPEEKNLYVFRLKKRDYLDEFNMIDSRLSQFEDLVSKMQEEINSKDYFLLGEENND